MDYPSGAGGDRGEWGRGRCRLFAEIVAVGLLAGCGGPGSIELPVPTAPGSGLPWPTAVVINEVMSRNDSAWADPDAPTGADACPEYDDYIELYNVSDEAVDLAGTTIADAETTFTFGERILVAGERLVLIADDDEAQGETHLPFKVSAEGETLTLKGPDGAMLDQVEVPALDSDTSWARYGDGSASFRIQAPSPGLANERPPDDDCLLPMLGFDDHTAPCIDTVEGFEALADQRSGLSVVKFDLLSFQEPSARHMAFLDTRFYHLHDEWYLFRMLNGQPVAGEDLYAPYPGSFATIDEIYDWAATVDLDELFPREFIRLTDSGRLTSSRYYSLVLGDPRIIGAGTLIRAPATPDRPEAWAFELEYGDDITYDELVAYFETLSSSLGAPIRDELQWLIRSPAQEALAQEMEAQQLPYADRLLRYAELSAPGQVDVYNEGIVAGRVRVIAAGEPIDALPGDILVLEEIPDELPPCAALITSVQQTPLAHIALLAESRGIPNLHVAGLSDDPAWTNWSRARANVVLRATAPDRFEVAAIDGEDWATWLALQERSAPTLDRVDTTGLPWAVDPATLPAEALLDWRPVLGGKASGFLVLFETVAAPVAVPDAALGITVRAYHDHVDAMGFVDPLLADPSFADPGDPRGRYLALEGQGGYTDRFAEPGDADYLAQFLADHPPGELLGDLARAGGLRERFDEVPIAAAILDPLEAALADRFSHYAPAQGLRFRSSSNVEDIEGFVGAGLYQSHTGYLDPAKAAEQGDRTVARALQRVWASYWGVEAFEERHAAHIPHENGGMGVLVHANFPDPQERSNGVITATRAPDGGAQMVVNAQLGAISVTNPPTDGCRTVLPEVATVSEAPDGTVSIVRQQASTEQPDGDVLSDGALLLLFGESLAVVDRWLQIENLALPETHARTTLTLDLEFRQMAEDWPALASGAASGERFVLKQARSLEPSPLGLPPDVIAAPFPRDLLARAVAVTEASCVADGHTLIATEATTDPSLAPDLGYADEPFTAAIVVDGIALDHTGWADTDHPAGDWGIAVDLDAEASLATGIASIAVEDGRMRVEGDAPFAAPLDAPCEVATLWASPDQFLDQLLDAASGP